MGIVFLMATYYTGRRTPSSSNSATWTPNRNAVRHESQIRLGPVWRGVILASIVVLIGLFTVSQSAKITAYDVEIAGVDDEIASLEAQRDALVVENAKMTAAASTEAGNEVASTMVAASSAGFVEE